ncbi:MAG: cytochrome c oxidase subunit 3 [Deltaproteobacteria bacterium]|nr:cytochrome c oxidase subunit 3 [Deltaproteobacteria bacterium]MBW2394969.1 cytochrome c oxidase subunit 3 [Deltaproteobacteria bacterium]
MSGAQAPAIQGRELPGGTVIWLFVAIELLTFGLFFVGFAWARRSNPAPFLAGQGQLHPLLGAINTGVLLSGGWLAARGVLANRSGKTRATAAFLTGAAVSGILFMAIKLHEYADVFEAGVSLSTNTFWFFYLFLTGLHFLHVLAGVGFLLPTAWRAAGGAYGPENRSTVEAVAVFWHMVDLIWIFLFPLIYLAR